MLGNNSNKRAQFCSPSPQSLREVASRVISAGEDFTCAVKVVVFSAGDTMPTEEVGSTASSLDSPFRIIPQRKLIVSDVSAGVNHTCVVLVGWRCPLLGRNTFSQLGGNAFSDSLSPIQAIPSWQAVASAITSGSESQLRAHWRSFQMLGRYRPNRQNCDPGNPFYASVPMGARRGGHRCRDQQYMRNDWNVRCAMLGRK